MAFVRRPQAANGVAISRYRYALQRDREARDIWVSRVMSCLKSDWRLRSIVRPGVTFFPAPAGIRPGAPAASASDRRDRECGAHVDVARLAIHMESGTYAWRYSADSKQLLVAM